MISIHAPHARSDTAGDCTAQKTGYFNPRSSCEERQRTGPHEAARYAISIHAPHARSDFIVDDCGKALNDISIHAPHARSDRTRCRGGSRHDYFNPRSSCEERPNHRKSITIAVIFQSTLLMRGATGDIDGFVIIAQFQSTLLMRGATAHFLANSALFEISIHAPHARSDFDKSKSDSDKKISIHAPHARSDCSTPSRRGSASDFNPRSSCEERRPRRP